MAIERYVEPDAPTIEIDPTPRKPVFNRADHCRAIAAKGGMTTVERYGRSHMKTIGKCGFRTYAERYHDGNRAKAWAGLSEAKPKTFSKRSNA